MKGVKIYRVPTDIKQDIQKMKELNIDTVLLGNEASFNRRFIDSIKDVGINPFIVFPVFYNPDYLKKNKESWSITQKDKQASDSWVHFVCPSNRKYLEYQKKKISDLAKSMNPYGITLDFIRFFAFWEMVEPSKNSEDIDHGCFCDHCIENFSKQASIPENLSGIKRNMWILREIPELWAEWKQSVILSAAEELIESIHSVKVDLKTAIHIVPWKSGEFNNGLQVITGQNIERLSKITDFLTPMTYAPMCHRKSEWINELVCDLKSRSKTPIIPALQVSEAYGEEQISPERFRADLKSALQKPSEGVLLWSWETLIESPEKYKMFEEI